MNLAISFRSELQKTRRTSSFYLMVFGALFIPLIKLAEMLASSKAMAGLSDDPWQIYYKNGVNVMIGLLLPLYIILITTLLTQMEYRNNTWKQVFLSPQSELSVFISKFLNLQFLIISFLLLNAAFLFVAVLLFNVIDPKFDLLHQHFDWLYLLEILSKAFFCSLAISSIQFWMSLRFRNFILPLSLGFALWFAGLMMIFEYKSMSKEWYPYSYLLMLILPDYVHLHLTLIGNTLIFVSVFLIAGFLDFKHRKGKG